MNAFDTRYTAFVLVAEAGERPLYSWDAWRRAVPLLDPIVAAARGDKPAVWVSNQHPGGGYGNYGKLGWNARGHQRWPVGAPMVAPENRKAAFLSFHLWKPSWPTSRKEGVGPDVYLQLWDPRPSGHRIPGFDYAFLLAVSENLPLAARRAAPAAVREIAQMVRPTIAVTARRPWAIDPADVLYPKQAAPAKSKSKAGAKSKAEEKRDLDTLLDWYLGSLVHSYWQHQRKNERPTLAHFGKGWELFPWKGTAGKSDPGLKP